MFILFFSHYVSDFRLYATLGTHGDAPPLQLLEDVGDGHGEAERQLAAPLLRVGGRNDADVGPVGPSRVPAVEPLQQVLQVSRQQDGLPAQRLHAGHLKHLGTVVRHGPRRVIDI